MGTTEDRNHFKTYRNQTKVKHGIISKYTPAYFDILKKWQGRLLYIDAFAGAGYYTDGESTKHPGSPIRALQLLQDEARFRKPVRCVFSEPDKQLYQSLEDAVESFCDDHPEVPPPIMYQATFLELIDDLRGEHGDDLATLAPAFLLVDPCGIKGASMEALTRILRRQYSEVFIFFNSAGLGRVIGAELFETLEEFYGDADCAREVIEDCEKANGPIDKEEMMLAAYERQLKSLGNATHVCPFRIEYEGKETTSHYLIHATKHELAFVIMKDIMWDLGSGEALELLQRSGGYESQLHLLPTDSTVDEVIVDELGGQARLVSYFTKDLASRPDDRVARKYYKARLLALEESGELEVWRNDQPAPADSRQQRHGKATLADSCEVRLAD